MMRQALEEYLEKGETNEDLIYRYVIPSRVLERQLYLGTRASSALKWQLHQSKGAFSGDCCGP